jgi:hypothetical protein
MFDEADDNDDDDEEVAVDEDGDEDDDEVVASESDTGAGERLSSGMRAAVGEPADERAKTGAGDSERLGAGDRVTALGVGAGDGDGDKARARLLAEGPPGDNGANDSAFGANAAEDAEPDKDNDSDGLP